MGMADAAGAATMLREVDALLRRQPNLGTLPAQTDELRASVKTMHAESPGASSLTTAELRMLPYLGTHLTFREIGARLYISHHTVKSHAMAIYRKLNVTSRNDAVERTRELGLRLTRRVRPFHAIGAMTSGVPASEAAGTRTHAGEEEMAGYKETLRSLALNDKRFVESVLAGGNGTIGILPLDQKQKRWSASGPRLRSAPRSAPTTRTSTWHWPRAPISTKSSGP